MAASAWAERAIATLSALALGALVALLVGMANAGAHPMPETRAWVDTTAGGLRLTLQMPLNRLELAFGQPLADAPHEALARHREALSAYLLEHTGARGADNQGWTVLRPQLRVLDAAAPGGGAELEAVMDLRAPPGADARRTTLFFDAITHEVRTHRVQVLLRRDWAGGLGHGAPQPLGELHSGLSQLALDLPPPDRGRAFLGLVAAGAAHLADGSDHLLFLALLLLVAPLQAVGGRWSTTPRAPRPALRQVVGLVTAFTLGHSVTLALAALQWLRLPSALVEVAVAATIAAAAVQAARPWGARTDTALAAAFGLVHGLAFAASLDAAGLAPGELALALLGFNLGIEAAQLLTVAAVVPPLLRLARHAPAGYARLRQVGAALGGLAAAVWLAERCGWINEVLPAPEAATRAAALGVLLALLWACAALQPAARANVGPVA